MPDAGATPMGGATPVGAATPGGWATPGGGATPTGVNTPIGGATPTGGATLTRAATPRGSSPTLQYSRPPRHLLTPLPSAAGWMRALPPSVPSRYTPPHPRTQLRRGVERPGRHDASHGPCSMIKARGAHTPSPKSSAPPKPRSNTQTYMVDPPHTHCSSLPTMTLTLPPSYPHLTPASSSTPPTPPHRTLPHPAQLCTPHPTLPNLLPPPPPPQCARSARGASLRSP